MIEEREEEKVKAKIPEHGTRKRYNHKDYPCRCAECRKASRLYLRARRIKLGLPVRSDGALPGQMGLEGIGEDV